MPFTPYHFGVGVAAKAVFPSRFSLGLFIALQVVIDLESLYNLAYHRFPIHRFLHTFVGATLLGAISSAFVLGAILWLRPGVHEPTARLFGSLLIVALFATWSHVVLDGVMHSDIRPFWPFTDRNPLLSLVGLGTLHRACIGLGVVGLAALALRWSLRDHGG